ncbi:MAG TPA: hypothetical protein H9836_05525 [Candidatus Nocardiopsis merdipullorum]|nr:hypothetical protein [Candidatus Nocardiopsis merdipullorum]
MPAPRSGGTSSRGEVSRTYIGWRYEVLLSHPGSAPRRPAPEDVDNTGTEWAAAERDSEAQTNRPLHIALCGLALLALMFPLSWTLRILPGNLALGGVFACVAIAAPVVVALLQSRQVVAERLARAQERLVAEREERDRVLHERQREHARRYTEWRAAVRAYEAQPCWYGVTVPEQAEAALVIGGTDMGWSALLNTIGMSRLREGGDLTVVDLTGRAVCGELARLARRCTVAPRHWVLPADLPRLTLGTNLDAGQRARILSAVAAAAGGEDVDADETLLLRLLEVLGPHAGINEIIGGLRTLLTSKDDSAEDDPALFLLTDEQRTRVRERCGQTPEVRGRAWELERLLAPFEAVGTRGGEDGYAQIKIISTDRASGEDAARVYGTYAVAALSELLEARVPDGPTGGRAPRVRPDRTRTVVVSGAEVLPEEEIAQVLTAAKESGVEVVLMFRTGVPAALSRFTDPAFLPVVMRQSGTEAEDIAQAIADHPGTAKDTQLRVHRLSDAVEDMVQAAATEQKEDPDSEIVDESRFFPSPHTESGAVIRDAAAAVPPLDLVRHVKSTTTWGRTTAQVEEDGPVSTTENHFGAPLRNIDLGSESLRELPITAALVLGPDGPVLIDTNPGILTLPTATLATVDDSRHTGHHTDVKHRESGKVPGHGGTTEERRHRVVPVNPPGTASGVATKATGSAEPPARVGADTGRFLDEVPPNLGPPPERLDWRS